MNGSGVSWIVLGLGFRVQGLGFRAMIFAMFTGGWRGGCEAVHVNLLDPKPEAQNPKPSAESLSP